MYVELPSLIPLSKSLLLIRSPTIQYDSPSLGHHIAKLYRGLNYTSFTLTNQSASMSPPNHIISTAGTSLKEIAIGPAPFISFSLRSVALSCLQTVTLPQLVCTVLIVGTKAGGGSPNVTSTSSLGRVTKTVTITGADSGTAQGMTKVHLQDEVVEDWTGLKSVSFDAEIDGHSAGLGVDDLDYDLRTRGCYFDAGS